MAWLVLTQMPVRWAVADGRSVARSRVRSILRGPGRGGRVGAEVCFPRARVGL